MSRPGILEHALERGIQVPFAIREEVPINAQRRADVSMAEPLLDVERVSSLRDEDRRGCVP